VSCQIIGMATLVLGKESLICILTTNLLRPRTKNFTNMHLAVKLLRLLADWELK